MDRLLRALRRSWEFQLAMAGFGAGLGGAGFHLFGDGGSLIWASLYLVLALINALLIRPALDRAHARNEAYWGSKFAAERGQKGR